MQLGFLSPPPHERGPEKREQHQILPKGPTDSGTDVKDARTRAAAGGEEEESKEVILANRRTPGPVGTDWARLERRATTARPRPVQGEGGGDHSALNRSDVWEGWTDRPTDLVRGRTAPIPGRPMGPSHPTTASQESQTA